MNNDDKLHEPWEEFYWALSGKGPMRMVSLLEIMGTTVKATCTKCKRWQTAVSLDEKEAEHQLMEKGWQLPEELCPKCQTSK